MRPQGTVNAIMLFVDYPDKAGTQKPSDIFDRYVKQAMQWYQAASYGRFNLNVTAVNSWFRMPQPSTAYFTRAHPSFDRQRQLMQDAVDATGGSVNFGGYDELYVVSPDGSGIDYSPGFTPNSPFFGINAGGNVIWHGATFGNDLYILPSENYGASVIVHETGHTFGLPDLYELGRTTFPFSIFVGNWDVMGNEDVGAGFLAWQRLQLGWLDESAIACVSAPGEQDVQIAPIEQASGTRAAIVRTGPTNFIVAENRLPINEDARLCSGSGVLIYSVNAQVEDGQGPIRVIPAGPDPDTSQSRIRTCGLMYAAPFTVPPGNSDFHDQANNVEIKLLCQLLDKSYIVRVAYGQATSSGPNASCQAAAAQTAAPKAPAPAKTAKPSAKKSTPKRIAKPTKKAVTKPAAKRPTGKKHARTH